MAELFAYCVVLNGIVLALSTQETVFAAYMTYRAFAGQGRRGASAATDRCERQSALGLWQLHQARLIGSRRAPRMGFCRLKKRGSKIRPRQAGWDSRDGAPGLDARP